MDNHLFIPYSSLTYSKPWVRPGSRVAVLKRALLSSEPPISALLEPRRPHPVCRNPGRHILGAKVAYVLV